MLNKQIVAPKEVNALAEIGQQIDGKFSFVIDKEDKLYQVHEFVKCRDFLGDIVWFNRYGRPTAIYGFKSNVDRKIDPDKTSLLFKGASTTLENVIKNVATVIHPIEEANGMTLTKVTPILAEPDKVLIEGDKLWQKTLWGISLYTFLIKVCAYALNDTDTWFNQIKATQTNEAHYLKYTEKFLEGVLRNLTTLLNSSDLIVGEEKEDQMHISSIHNSCGFVSILAQAGWTKKTNFFSKQIAELKPA